MIKNPDTGKRVSRPICRREWQTVEVPELTIISQRFFDFVQRRRKARRQTHPAQQRRPRHILSGLLRCGCCGAGMSTSGKDKSGRIRVRCSAGTESGTCPDAKTFYLATIEKAVLSGLQAELKHPAVLAAYVKTYHQERKRLASEAIVARTRLERELAGEARDRAGLDRDFKGYRRPGDNWARGPLLSAQRKRLRAELEAAPDPPNVVALHPAAFPLRGTGQPASGGACRGGSCWGHGSRRGPARPNRNRHSVPGRDAPGRRAGRDFGQAHRPAGRTRVPEQGSRSVGNGGSGGGT